VHEATVAQGGHWQQQQVALDLAQDEGVLAARGLQEQMLQAAAGNDVWVDVCMGGQVRDSATHSNQQLFSGKTH
jgi:hypothetical protein